VNRKVRLVMRFVNLAEVISYRAVLREYPGGFQIFFGLIVKEAASAYELGGQAKSSTRGSLVQIHPPQPNAIIKLRDIYLNGFGFVWVQ